jgi:hypothetical protein
MATAYGRSPRNNQRKDLPRFETGNSGGPVPNPNAILQEDRRRKSSLPRHYSFYLLGGVHIVISISPFLGLGADQESKLNDMIT